MLWSVDDAVAATGGEAKGNWAGVDGVSIDTRELAPGDLFVALTGDNRDGHAFVGQALTDGAGAALVSHVPEGVAADAPLLVVDDTLVALEKLGAAARARTRARVIAVTGSVGKTSTKDMIQTMLAGQGKVHAAVRSFNNHWGVPLTLARMPADTDWAVIEIGMNHAGEIGPLSRLARPHVALITTVAPVHLAAFDGIEGIADAKAEIFEGLEPDGIAILNGDIETFPRLLAATGERETITFGEGDTHYHMPHALVEATRTIVELEAPDFTITFRVGAPGRHIAVNAVAAMATVVEAGGDPAMSAKALEHWTPPDGRGQRVTIDLHGGGQLLLLDESYNANPTSVEAALGVLAVTGDRKAKRHAFLGDMLELGPAEVDFHKALSKLLAVEAIGQIHCCGPLMRALWERLPRETRGIYAADSEDLAKSVHSVLAPGDVCMVKGSLGARMSVVVGAIKALSEPRPTTDEDL